MHEKGTWLFSANQKSVIFHVYQYIHLHHSPSFLFPSDTRHKAGNHVRTTFETGKTKYFLEFFSLP